MLKFQAQVRKNTLISPSPSVNVRMSQKIYHYESYVIHIIYNFAKDNFQLNK